MNVWHDEKVQNRYFSLGLIGFPLGHSLSPQIHNAALGALELDGEYSSYAIPPSPEGQIELADLLEKVRRGDIHGLNVTIPHKQNVIPYLDELTPAAKTIGSVNTIFRQGELLIGDNTDASGFWVDVQRLAESQKLQDDLQPTPHAALILGAGGSARAVVYALLSQGYTVSIAARRIEQACQIGNHFLDFSDQITVLDWTNWHADPCHFSLIVNTTPVGMSPETGASPWPQGVPFPADAMLYDLVYNPSITMLVKQARTAGLNAETGLGMLVEQAALAFERWTGRSAPRQIMYKAAEGRK